MESGRDFNVVKDGIFDGPIPKVIEGATALIRNSEMQEMFLNDPQFSEPGKSAVRMVLENSITSRVLRRGDAIVGAMGEDAYRELSEYERAAIQYVYGKGSITTRELAARINRSSVFSSKTLKGLAKKKLLTWHGNSPNDPSQYYSLPK